METENLATILDATSGLVATIDRWDAPTPCPEWNVRELVGHMVLGNRLFTGILHGEAGGTLDPKGQDVLGADPAGTYRQAADELLVAFRLPGVLERIVQVPVGPVPGIAAVHLRAVEELTHGWDLAQATGRQLDVPGDVVEREIEFTRGKLADVPPDRSPFAPPQPVPDDASPLDRLAALLGRKVEPALPSGCP
ncbi:TIGR03086 family metal-binding protein [Amycolatopsis suaedae]|uniref:TIGR03086 family protein n=1 Tax=Amycolatopsis suaedae TaxID=2510978 RepID=A0A4Q7J8X8_9PSEU|nr:TIGR03086 family metal-binding protein [Amycolatopsis suaedae]RZQ63376.1 TIGR03086 family protein [Amycolatopsis suaedae]